MVVCLATCDRSPDEFLLRSENAPLLTIQKLRTSRFFIRIQMIRSIGLSDLLSLQAIRFCSQLIRFPVAHVITISFNRFNSRRIDSNFLILYNMLFFEELRIFPCYNVVISISPINFDSARLSTPKYWVLY